MCALRKNARPHAVGETGSVTRGDTAGLVPRSSLSEVEYKMIVLDGVLPKLTPLQRETLSHGEKGKPPVLHLLSYRTQASPTLLVLSSSQVLRLHGGPVLPCGQT